MLNELSRRNFLSRAGGAVSAVWLSEHWPAILAASEHAHQATKSAPAKFKFFSPEHAVEIGAITARIIPSDETPGAREAGVVYFIDHALTTIATDDQNSYTEGLPAIQSRVHELFPSLEKFSAASAEQQDQVLHSFDEKNEYGRRFHSNATAKPFFETVRVHTIIGFLIDPDSGGNRDGVGWRVIGRDRQHMFQPPFGYYDKDYAGWQPKPAGSEKTKA